LEIKLDFLKKGVEYQATIFGDAPDTHFINNKEAYIIRKINLKQSDIITAKLAPGGGHCVILEPSR